MNSKVDKITDGILKRDLNLSRVSASERKRIMKALKKLAKELAGDVYKYDDFISMSKSERRRMLNKCLSEGGKSIDAALGSFNNEFTGTLAEVVAFEAENLGKSIATTIGTVDMSKDALTLTQEQSEMLLKDTWVNNRSVKEMLDGHTAYVTDQFKQIVRRGYAQGLTNEQIAREIRGYTDKDGVVHQGLDSISKKQSESMVRTSVLSMGNNARLEMYRKNADVIACVKWIATLDMRTCTRCGNRDGLCWTLDGDPIGHDVPFEAPPFHRNCRCSLTCMTKMFTEIKDGNVIDTSTPSTRASSDGQVSNRIDFAQWFESMSPEEQAAYLGKGRWELYKAGKITYSDLMDQNGRGLTVKELRKKYK